MVDNIKVNIPLAAISSAKSVKPVDHRENDNRNYFFKDTFKERQKKKKRKYPLNVKISAKAALVGNPPPIRHGAAKKNYRYKGLAVLINALKHFVMRRSFSIRYR